MESNQFGLFATSTAQIHDAPAVGGAVHGVPSIEKITFHLLRCLFIFLYIWFFVLFFGLQNNQANHTLFTLDLCIFPHFSPINY